MTSFGDGRYVISKDPVVVPRTEISGTFHLFFPPIYPLLFFDLPADLV